MAAPPALSAGTPSSHPFSDMLTARVRYGAALRQGTQRDAGPGFDYGGVTGNDLSLEIAAFGTGHFGGGAQLHREAFALLDESRRVEGSLLRFQGGAGGRVKLGPVRLELMAGYGYAQLPDFAPSNSPSFNRAQRHSALLASRVLVHLPLDLTGEVRGEYPLPLAVIDAAGRKAQATGFAAGGKIAIPVGSLHALEYGLALDYQFVSDRLVTQAGSTAQAVSRLGAAVELRWLDAPPPPRFGGLIVLVIDSETGTAIAGARVELRAGDEEPKTLTAGDDGRVSAARLGPGPWIARVAAAGYLPSEARAVVAAGQEVTAAVQAKKEPPKTGSLAISVVSRETGNPIAGAVVAVQGKEYQSDQAGSVTVEGLLPGLVPIAVKARGYRDASEVGSVVALKSSEVPIALAEAEKPVPAVIKGTVKSRQGGKPVAATLEIPEARIKTSADARGAFTFRVEAGTYRVMISAPGFLHQQKDITVKPGDQAIFNIVLHPE